MQEELVDQETVAGSRKRLFMIFGILITLLLLGLLLYYVNCVRPVEQFRTLYDHQQYDEAYALYEDTLTAISGNARKAEQVVEDRLLSCWADYEEAAITRDAMDAAWNDAVRYTALSDTLAELTPARDALYASRDAYETGLQQLADEEWLAASESFGNMSESDTLYAEGARQSAAATEGYAAAIVEQTNALMSAASYSEAMALTEAALKQFPDQPLLLAQKETIYTAYQDYQKQTSLAAAQELLDQGNLQETLRILTGLQKDFPEDTEIADFTAHYEAAYCEQILAQAQPLFDQGLYAEALTVLSPAYEILPGNAQIAELYDRTAGHLPAWLDAFASVNESLRGSRTKEETSRDTFGNTYSHTMIYTEPSALSMQTMTYSEGRETYNLKGSYTRLLGTLAVKEGSRGIQNDRTGIFRIYGDGTLLWELNGISETSNPAAFSIDVTGVKELSFTFESGTGLKYLLGDVCVYKTYTEPETDTVEDT